MPLQWCAHLWGCLWGIGGCYPSRTPSLVLAPGWWPGGLIPYLKGCWIPIPGRPAGRGQGRLLQQQDGERISTSCYIPTTSLTFQTTGRRATSVQGQRGLEPLSPAGPHCSSGTVQAGSLRRFLHGGGSFLRPPAHVWATGLPGAVVPLSSLSLQQKKKKPEGKALTGPEAPA